MNDGSTYNYTNDKSMCPIHLTDNWNVIKAMRELTMEEAENALQSYTKFAFVRNPLDRLVSAWGDKLGPNASISKLYFWVCKLLNTFVFFIPYTTFIIIVARYLQCTTSFRH